MGAAVTGGGGTRLVAGGGVTGGVREGEGLDTFDARDAGGAEVGPLVLVVRVVAVEGKVLRDGLDPRRPLRQHHHHED